MREKEPTREGVLVIDKPAGLTSHAVVDRIRRRWRLSKAGHLGTLDPAATGVLPVMIGRATRLARFIPSNPKEYVGTIRLGWETTTGDAEGDPLGPPTPVDLARERIETAAAAFEGRVEQIPPAYSAKKVGGVAAYRLARKGKPVTLSPINVEIQQFSIVSVDGSEISFRVLCSAGTYIRSLARDLGRHLKTGAHLGALRRTRSGPFDLSHAELLDKAEPTDVIPSEELMQHLPEIRVDPQAEVDVGHGRAIECGTDDSPVRIFNKKGQLIAIATVERGWAHPRVVLV